MVWKWDERFWFQIDSQSRIWKVRRAFSFSLLESELILPAALNIYRLKLSTLVSIGWFYVWIWLGHSNTPVCFGLSRSSCLWMNTSRFISPSCFPPSAGKTVFLSDGFVHFQIIAATPQTFTGRDISGGRSNSSSAANFLVKLQNWKRVEEQQRS